MKKFLPYILTVFISISVPVFATDYYVDSTCSGSGNGTTDVCDDGGNGPWKTLAEAESGVATGVNHTIHVADGSYAAVTMARSGPGTTPSVDASYRIWKCTGDAANLTGMITITGSWVKLDGFNFPSDSDRAITTTGSPNGSNCWFINFTAVSRGTTSGATINGTDNIIENWDYSNCSDYWHVFGSGHIFRGNYVHNHLNGGTSHDDVWQTYDPVAQDILIENNHVFMGNDSTGALADRGYSTHTFMWGDDVAERRATGLVIRNNIFEAPGWFNSDKGQVDGLRMYNNLWRGDIDITTAASQVVIASSRDNADDIKIRNNIFIDKTLGVSINATATNVICSNNLFWRNDSESISNTNYTSSNDVTGDNPDFTTYSSTVYNLTTAYIPQAESPLVDAGINLYSDGVIIDYADVARPAAAAFEIGPYEYEAAEEPTIGISAGSGTISAGSGSIAGQ